MGVEISLIRLGLPAAASAEPPRGVKPTTAGAASQFEFRLSTPKRALLLGLDTERIAPGPAIPIWRLSRASTFWRERLAPRDSCGYNALENLAFGAAMLSLSNRDTYDVFYIYRDYVKHQYSLTDHRTTWFVSINSFLFAAFAITLQTLASATNGHLSDIRADTLILLRVICFVGAYSALIAYILIESSRRPIGRIAEKWEKHIGTDKLEDKVADELKGTDLLLLVGGVSRAAAFWGRFGTPLFTLVVAVAWLALIYFSKFATITGHELTSWSVKFIISVPTLLIFSDFVLYLSRFTKPKVNFIVYLDRFAMSRAVINRAKEYLKNARYG